MKRKSFLQFSAPSLLLMLALLAFPMAMTLWLSVRNCTPQLELVTVQQTGPFGPATVTTQRARVDAAGRALRDCRFVGLSYYRNILGLDKPAASDESAKPPGSRPSPAATVTTNSCAPWASRCCTRWPPHPSSWPVAWRWRWP